MSDWTERYKRPYVYNSKIVKNGIVDKIKHLKKEGKSFSEIGKILGKSRQQISQIYYKSIAKGY